MRPGADGLRLDVAIKPGWLACTTFDSPCRGCTPCGPARIGVRAPRGPARIGVRALLVVHDNEREWHEQTYRAAAAGNLLRPGGG